MKLENKVINGVSGAFGFLFCNSGRGNVLIHSFMMVSPYNFESEEDARKAVNPPKKKAIKIKRKFNRCCMEARNFVEMEVLNSLNVQNSKD